MSSRLAELDAEKEVVGGVLPQNNRHTVRLCMPWNFSMLFVQELKEPAGVDLKQVDAIMAVSLILVCRLHVFVR